jgi:hypothetical protein
MCCFAALLAILGPRFGILVWYLAEPTRWNLAFSTWIWPLLGALFLPWTTLMYVAVATGGVHGFNWFWIGLGIVADIACYAGGGREGGRKVAARS